MAVIYLLTNNINGKLYVGYTKNYEKRIKTYKNYTKSQYNKKRRKIENAIIKYGWENFSVEVIFEHKNNDYVLNTMEKIFIEKYDSFNNGYNMTLGGEGCLGFQHSDEERILMSERFRGENNPYHASKGRLNPMLGRTHTEESINKMKVNRKGLTAGKNNPMYGNGSVISGDKNGRSKQIEIFGQSFSSMVECERILNISRYYLRKIVLGEINEEMLIKIIGKNK